MTFDEKVREYCPMEGTTYEGYCVDNHATIRVKTAKCNHRDHCEQLKKELDEKNENQ